MTVRVGPPRVTSHLDDQILVCDPSGAIEREGELGYFVADTRFVSCHSMRLNDERPLLLNSGAVSHFGSRFEFTNPVLTGPGDDIPEHTLHLRLDRSVGDGVHEDYDLTNYGTDPIRVRLEIAIESDFADLMDVKSHQLVRRGVIQSNWDVDAQRLVTTYTNGDFVRSLIVRADRSDSEPQHANSRLGFDIELPPASTWHTCMYWLPTIDDRSRSDVPLRGCHQLSRADTPPDQHREAFIDESTRFVTSDADVDATVAQAIADVGALRLVAHDQRLGDGDRPLHGWVPAAGVPWFVAPFGRDTLTIGLQTMLVSTDVAVGSLKMFGDLQADADDPRHDEQPGKIVHELRHGELAHLGLIPQTPYFGTADAPALYVLAAAELWRWTGSRTAVAELEPNVSRALEWIDHFGDLDGDGLQEYRTRAGDWGFTNQSWKDSDESMVHGDGATPPLPVAPCELQGYVVAAKRSWADVLEQCLDDDDAAQRLRREATELTERIEERYWWEAEGTYYLALDGEKRPLESVASNPGHLLWTGSIDASRAARVAERLLADDMWTGWGVRTLSSSHPAYNPFSYQRGTVWPHDNAIFAAGLHRYGLHGAAHRITRGLFDAADHLDNRRLPELFAGLTRDADSFPVQYLGANVPQGWASGAVVHLLTSMVGATPDAAAGRLVLDPHLPDWLERVELHGVRVGQARVDVRIVRAGDGSRIELEQLDGDLDVSSRDGSRDPEV